MSALPSPSRDGREPRRDAGPLPPPLRAAAPLLESLYLVGLRASMRGYERGRGIVTIDRPVISVGNLSVGGTGKTPVVAWVVRTLLADGRDPAIAMRGYRAGPSGMSDEAQLYADEFPQTPVVAQANRLDGLLHMFATERGERVDSVVLDDGFQHRRLARQLDLVLIDAARSPFEDRPLPAGWLREPPAALGRAHHVVLTHADRAADDDLERLRGRVGAVLGRPPIAECRHAWDGVSVRVVEGDRVEPAAWLRGRRVALVCAIGNPGRFREQAERAGARIEQALVLGDHDPYATGTLRRLLRLAASVDAVLTTEKDWAKLRLVRPELWPCPVARPRLSIAFERGEAALREAVLAAAEADV